MKHYALLCLLLVLASLAACAAPDSEPEHPGVPPARRLAGTEWLLVDVGGKSVIPASGQRVAFLSFDAEASSVRGHSGVNSFFGPYAQDGDALRVEQLGMTRMAGPPDLMEQESAFTSAIHAARSFRITGEELVLLDGRGSELARLLAKPD